MSLVKDNCDGMSVQKQQTRSRLVHDGEAFRVVAAKADVVLRAVNFRAPLGYPSPGALSRIVEVVSSAAR